MTVSSDVKAIISFFADQFDALHPEILISHDNVTFEPPATTWVRILVSPTSTRAVSIGGQQIRHTGIAHVQIFATLNQGAGESLLLCDEIIPLFRHVQIGNLRFGDPSAIRIGPDETHYQMNVQIPYQSDEFL